MMARLSKPANQSRVVEKDGTLPNVAEIGELTGSFAHVIGIGQSRVSELWDALESFDLIWKVPEPRLLRTRRGYR
jgi:hypothetical protein